MADVMQFLFYLDQLNELGFSIDVKRPPNHDGWECSITFNGKDTTASENADMCLFLEEFNEKREEYASYAQTAQAYQNWKDKTLAYYANRHPECEYLLSTPDGKHFLYRNYKDSYYTTIMEQIGIKWSPHCTRHTTISMMKEHRIDETTIKKIVGHSGAMTLTERVYTHLDVQVLIDAINKIVGERENGKEEK